MVPSYKTPHITLQWLPKYCRLPTIWKTSLVIPMPKPDKDSSQGTSYRPISLLCPSAKVLEALILPSSTNFSHQQKINTTSDPDTRLHLPSSSSQQTSRQRKSPHRTVSVAIDMTAAYDTVSHDILISKIAGPSLSPAITRWLSCYLSWRQAATSFRCTKSSTRIVHTGITQGSKLSPWLFTYYIAEMPRPTSLVKRVCYADNITVWVSGPKIHSWSPWSTVTWEM